MSPNEGFYLLIGLAILIGMISLIASTNGEETAFRKAEESAPNELLTATPIRLTKTLRMTRPFALHGKPDQVYRLADGSVVVREDKLSAFSLNAAIIQASVYAAILRHNPPPELRGARVANHGWIRTGNPAHGKTRFHRITVLDDSQLRRLVDTYIALGEGFNPTKTQERVVCQRRCSHYRKRCDGA